MKTILTLCLFIGSISVLFAQNIDDNKVNFPYIQLPLQKINPQFKTYEVRTNHAYKNANNDSVIVYNSRKEAAQKAFEFQYNTWLEQKKIIEKNYLAQMAVYEKAVNAGTAATLPTAPVYPSAPLFVPIEKIKLNSEILETDVTNAITLQGFEKGLGGSIATITIHPIRSVKIVETKTGSGAATKYEYKCQYILPIEVSFETPTDGKLFNKILFDNIQNYPMKSYSSKYEYQSWFIDNSEKFFLDLEKEVRKSELIEVNQQLNSEFGFVKTTRSTEIYTIKKYKDYEYSDIVAAFTLTTQAFALVGNDRDRSSAMAKLDLAIAKWKSILEESNTIDEKARVNDKITAMIQCNLAELLVWKADFDQEELYVNLALNSGVFKLKNQAERVQSFYADQKKRWKANY